MIFNRAKWILITAIILIDLSSGLAQDNNHNTLLLSSGRFDYQQRCLHHDNFHREVTRKEKWMIGDNYRSSETYYSPRKDYMTVDDGFRIKTVYEETSDKRYPHKIVSGYLTNEQNVSVAKSFRFITLATKLKDDFFIETSVPNEGNVAELVFNYVNDYQYNSFEIIKNNERQAVISLKTITDGEEVADEMLRTSTNAETIKIAYVNGKTELYLDDKRINDRVSDRYYRLLDSFVIDKNKPLGIAISKERIYEYRILDVFSIDTLRHVTVEDSKEWNGIPKGMHSEYCYDYSYRYLPTIQVAGIGLTLPKIGRKYPSGCLFINESEGKIYRNDEGKWIITEKNLDDYGMYLSRMNHRIYTYEEGKLIKQSKARKDSFPKWIQRFEIRAIDVNNTKTAHCELAEDDDFSINNMNLRMRRISFCTFLSKSFLRDDNSAGDESLIQFQASTEGGKSRVPIFTIASKVVNGKEARFHLNRRYIPTRPVAEDANWGEIILGDNDIDLGKAKLGVWDKWEIFIKEGYMDEQCPILIVKRNGKEVYKSYSPNTYNVMYGSYIRYGVYKSIYKKVSNPNRRRIIYISNFECDI